MATWLSCMFWSGVAGVTRVLDLCPHVRETGFSLEHPLHPLGVGSLSARKLCQRLGLALARVCVPQGPRGPREGRTELIYIQATSP